MVRWWNLVIWVFFPIPFLSLVLLSIPGPAGLEKLGNAVVDKIFFSRVSLGPIKLRLLDFFVLLSALIFFSCVQAVSTKPLPCRSCRYESETYWYKKAMTFRAERNFWLSLFNTFLWFLVWRIHSMKGTIIKKKDEIQTLQANLKNVVEDAVKNTEDKKDD